MPNVGLVETVRKMENQGVMMADGMDNFFVTIFRFQYTLGYCIIKVRLADLQPLMKDLDVAISQVNMRRCDVH